MMLSPSTPIFTPSAPGGQTAGPQTRDGGGDFDGLLAGLGGDANASPDRTQSDNDNTAVMTEPPVWTGSGVQDVTRLAQIAAVTGATAGASDDGDATGGGWPQPGQDPADIPATSAAKKVAANEAAGSTSSKTADPKRSASTTSQDGATPVATGQGVAQPPTDLLSLLTLSAAAGAAGAAATRSVDGAALPHVGRSDTRPSKLDQVSAGPSVAPAPAGVSPGAGEAKATLVSHVTVATHLAPAATSASDHGAVAGAALAGSDSTGKAAPAAAPVAHADTPVAQAGTDANGPVGGVAIAAPQSVAAVQPPGGAGLVPMRTISSAVVALASQPEPVANGRTVPDDVGTITVPAAARTMTLQLQPADLGTVNVRLHVTGQTLDVELDVSDSQTLGIVSRERDTLASALRDQNYDLNTLVIKGSDAALSSSGDQNVGHQSSGGGSPATGGRQSGASAGQGGGQGGSTFTSGGRPTDAAGPADGTAPASGNALFV